MRRRGVRLALVREMREAARNGRNPQSDWDRPTQWLQGGRVPGPGPTPGQRPSDPPGRHLHPSSGKTAASPTRARAETCGRTIELGRSSTAGRRREASICARRAGRACATAKSESATESHGEHPPHDLQGRDEPRATVANVDTMIATRRGPLLWSRGWVAQSSRQPPATAPAANVGLMMPNISG